MCLRGEGTPKGGPGSLWLSPFHRYTELLLASKPQSGPLGHTVGKTTTPADILVVREWHR